MHSANGWTWRSSHVRPSVATGQQAGVAQLHIWGFFNQRYACMRHARTFVHTSRSRRIRQGLLIAKNSVCSDWTGLFHLRPKTIWTGSLVLGNVLGFTVSSIGPNRQLASRSFGIDLTDIEVEEAFFSGDLDQRAMILCK